VRFEWDRAKAAQNIAKHGVSFEEATTAFRDPVSTTGVDPDHSFDEERFITRGYNQDHQRARGNPQGADDL